ncbi:MAG TPA: ABC transporter substrate-binding protein, partial [Desulfobacterales bacterium]|nr:ABC transporter substrate-binding protein [Desulfobacterales bacterium]
MRTRKCLAVLAAVAVAVALAAGPVAAQQKTIKIGALYPLTGNLASTGMDCKRGVDLAVEIINGKYDLNLPFAKEEGIPGMGGAKIEVVYADTKGDPKNGLAEAERLITQEKVVALIGAYQSAVTKTGS